MFKTKPTQLNRKDWLCLSFLKGIGPARLSRLMQYLHAQDTFYGEQTDYGEHTENLEEHIDEDIDILSYAFLRKLKWPDTTAKQAMTYLSSGKLIDEQKVKLDQTHEWLENADHHLLMFYDDEYPRLLKEISVPPALLYINGSLDAMAYPKFAMVGARRCSKHGRDMTHYFAEALTDLGVCIVSGGAIGIDTAAHCGALKSNVAPSIAVMGTGLLNWYPEQNKPLYEALLNQGGLLLSEYPLTTQPRPNLFPPRNRIISGLSMALLVAEASIKSGSLISASYALQQNRDVFAFPGRLTDRQSAGCHQLIRQGASLVTKVEDILNECPLLLEKNAITEKRNKQLDAESLLSNKMLSNKIITNEEDQQTEQVFSPSAVPNKQISNEKKATKTISTLESTLSLSREARAVLNLLKDLSQKGDMSALDFDALIRLTKRDAGDLMQSLMELELNACIKNQQGLYWLIKNE
ncbi:DNA-processing protein DprA [Marinomonas sp. THO17]|uniref:DNA-processing protein DprA n=1 Tax=Marinomonas sp. THO17 TaxID=3149048 RepID=UPI00336BC14A